jgi:cobalt-zinc-cadmium resistance protein CzcA
MIKTSVDIPKTEISTGFGYLNSKDQTDVSLNISQSFSPFSYASKKRVLKKEFETSVIQNQGVRLEIEFAVRQAWENVLYAISKKELLGEQALLLKDFSKSARLRYETGETTLMESNVATAKEQELNVLITQNETYLFNEKSRLKALLNLNGDFEPVENEIEYDKHDPLEDFDLNQSISLQLAEKNIETQEAYRKKERALLFPDFTLGYTAESQAGAFENNGRIVNYGKDLRLSSYSVGISIPIFFGSQSANLKAMKYKTEQAKIERDYTVKQLKENIQQQIEIIKAQESVIDYYLDNALKNAAIIKEHASKSYNNGDISYIEYIQSMETALSIQINYLDAVLQYNLSHNSLHFLVNQ